MLALQNNASMEPVATPSSLNFNMMLEIRVY